MMSLQRINQLNLSMVVKTTDMQVGGAAARIIQSGYPDIIGDTILDKLQYSQDNLDHVRRLVMEEPRGHNEMHSAVLVEKDDKQADMAVLFLSSSGYSVMCGHATIALGRYAVDHGIVKGVSPETIVKIQCPCGLVTAHVEYQDGKAGAARFESVPCFVFAADQKINLEGYGEIHYDISYGGTFYVYCDLTQFGLNFKSSSVTDIATTAMKLRRAVAAKVTLTHHEDNDLAYFYGVIFYSGPLDNSDCFEETCIFADAQVDRSPCGSGSSGFLALLHHKGLVKEGEVRKFVNGKTRSSFNGKIMKQVKVKDTPAVIVEISGKGYYTGECTFYCEQDDPQPSFLVK
ncbi:trans-L-3-hydroxyproline dehydratase-like isoform X2 [Dysidea avara]|uniref:trans-L-3-hydroxyproline dehydratase-like isoform X2 n=1 Tax=Dysidea avara TaxID=196820 RepID=UPI003332F9D3